MFNLNLASLAGLSFEIPITTVFSSAKAFPNAEELHGFFGTAGSVSAWEKKYDHFFANLFC